MMEVILLERHAGVIDAIGDVLGPDRAIELAHLARLAHEDDGKPLEFPRNRFGLAPPLQIRRLEMGLLLLEIGAVGLGGAQRHFLR